MGSNQKPTRILTGNIYDSSQGLETLCLCKVNNLSPKLADATMKLVISEFVRFPKEKKCRKANIQSICPLLCTVQSSSILAYFHTCILAYTCILSYLYICMLAYLHTCILAYLHTCIYMHTCILAYLHTCILAYLHTCILVYPM